MRGRDRHGHPGVLARGDHDGDRERRALRGRLGPGGRQGAPRPGSWPPCERVGVHIDPHRLVSTLVDRRAAAGGDRQGALPRLPSADPRRADGRARPAGRAGAARHGGAAARPRDSASCSSRTSSRRSWRSPTGSIVLRRGRMVAERRTAERRSPTSSPALMMGVAETVTDDVAAAAAAAPDAPVQSTRRPARPAAGPPREPVLEVVRARGDARRARRRRPDRPDRARAARSSASPGSAATGRPSSSRRSAASPSPRAGRPAGRRRRHHRTWRCATGWPAGLGRLTEDRRGSCVAQLTRGAEPRARGPRRLHPPRVLSTARRCASTPGR